MLLKLDVRL